MSPRVLPRSSPTTTIASDSSCTPTRCSPCCAPARGLARGGRAAPRARATVVQPAESDPTAAAVSIRRLLRQRALMVVLTDLDDASVAASAGARGAAAGTAAPGAGRRRAQRRDRRSSPQRGARVAGSMDRARGGRARDARRRPARAPAAPRRAGRGAQRCSSLRRRCSLVTRRCADAPRLRVRARRRLHAPREQPPGQQRDIASQ